MTALELFKKWAFADYGKVLIRVVTDDSDDADIIYEGSAVDCNIDDLYKNIEAVTEGYQIDSFDVDNMLIVIDIKK